MGRERGGVSRTLTEALEAKPPETVAADMDIGARLDEEAAAEEALRA